jgi:hypothetical protein
MNANDRVLDLDAATAKVVEQLARAWGVSKQEAVRRAVSQAGAAGEPAQAPDRLAALRELQRRLQLTSDKAAAWQAAVHEGRR